MSWFGLFGGSMSWICSFGGIGTSLAQMMVNELDLLIWWSMSLDSGSIDLHTVISSSIYTTNKQIVAVNN